MIKNDVLLFLHIWHKSDVIFLSFSFIFFLLKLQPFSPIKSPVRQGGPSSPILFCQAAVLSYSSKLFWQLATLENCKEGKYDRNLLKGAENMQQWQKNWQNVEECGCTWDHLFEALQFISFRVPILFFKPSYSRQVRYILSPTCCVGEMRIWGVRGCVSIIHHLSVAPSWRAETLVAWE